MFTWEFVVAVLFTSIPLSIVLVGFWTGNGKAPVVRLVRAFLPRKAQDALAVLEDYTPEPTTDIVRSYDFHKWRYDYLRGYFLKAYDRMLGFLYPKQIVLMVGEHDEINVRNMPEVINCKWNGVVDIVIHSEGCTNFKNRASIDFDKVRVLGSESHHSKGNGRW